MKPITILDVALARGVDPEKLTMGTFAAVGLPLLGGCAHCGACIAAYNASPSKSGYLRCASGCIGDEGFPSVKAFEAWCAYEDALAEAAGDSAEADAPEHTQAWDLGSES